MKVDQWKLKKKTRISAENYEKCRGKKDIQKMWNESDEIVNFPEYEDKIPLFIFLLAYFSSID